MGYGFNSRGASAVNVVGDLTGTVTVSGGLATVTGTVSTRICQGLSATYFSALTVNTTGTAALAANADRQIGVWLWDDTTGINGRVGDALNTAVVPMRPLTTFAAPATFIPGGGAVYVKTDSGIANFHGYWI